MKSYCVKEKKQTESLNPVYVKTKNGRMAMKSKCASCGITKFQFVSNTKNKMIKNQIIN